MNIETKLNTDWIPHSNFILSFLIIMQITSFFALAETESNIFVFLWLSSIITIPLTIYFDYNRNSSNYEELIPRTVLTIGSILPFISSSCAGAYICRRHEIIKKEGAWAGWPVVVVLSIVISGMALGFMLLFDDPTTAGNTLLVNFGVSLLLSVTLLPGFAAYFDLKYLKTTGEYDFPRYNWLWVLGLMIWVLQFAVIIAWLIWRITISSSSNQRQMLSIIPEITTITPSAVQRQQVEPQTTESPEVSSDAADQNIDSANSSDLSSINQLKTNAESALEEATKADQNGDLETAKQLYNEALEQFEQFKETHDNVSDELNHKIDNKIDIIRNSVDDISQAYEQTRTLRNKLKTAERSFQEGIAGYLTGDHTLSQIRFRQARNGFEEASEIVEDSTESLLKQRISISANPQQTPPSEVLTDYSEFSNETFELLSAVDINLVQDIPLQEDSINPQLIDTFEDRGIPLSDQEATFLTILSWWPGKVPVSFQTRDDIDRRFEQAKYGFDKSR